LLGPHPTANTNTMTNAKKIAANLNILPLRFIVASLLVRKELWFNPTLLRILLY
jgi:hypothetical protein